MRGDYMLSAVTRALTAHYGDTLPVLTERPVQKKKPSDGEEIREYLFVHQINRDQAPDNYKRYNRFYFFDIRYHSDDKEQTQYRRFAQVAEELSEILLYIETDDQPAKASSIRSEVQDGILHTFVDYPIRVLRQTEPEPIMETLDFGEHLKE